jgi:hypothetical protein
MGFIKNKKLQHFTEQYNLINCKNRRVTPWCDRNHQTPTDITIYQNKWTRRMIKTDTNYKCGHAMAMSLHTHNAIIFLILVIYHIKFSYRRVMPWRDQNQLMQTTQIHTNNLFTKTVGARHVVAVYFQVSIYFKFNKIVD